MFEKVQSFLDKFVGPNAAHVLDGLIGVEISAGIAYASTPSVRTYADHHPLVSLGLAVGAPLATVLASKFRKAATKK